MDPRHSGTPETPNGLNFEDRGSPEIQHSETPDTLNFWVSGVSGVLEFGTPAVLKIETIGSLGSAGVPESQNHELYYSRQWGHLDGPHGPIL